MNFDDAIEMGNPSYAIKERFYQEFFRPFLNPEPARDAYQYFLDQAWFAWRHGVKKIDMQKVLFIQWMCNELLKNNSCELVQLMANIFDRTDDAATRISESERMFYEACKIETKFSTAVRHYKVFFESEFRLWATVPYYFLCKNYKIPNKASTPSTFVDISAAEKYQAIKNIKTQLIQGNFSDFVEGFDNELRNAGEGHDFYEITDNDTILFNVVDPETGKPKGSKQIELSYGQLDTIINKCRKSIWIFKNGIMIFLNNNPIIYSKIHNLRPLKVRDIFLRLKEFADERWFSLDEFNFDPNRQKANLTISYKKKIVGHGGGEIIFGNGERYDVISIEIRVKYLDQTLGVLQRFVMMIGKNRIPEIKIKVIDAEKKIISDMEFSKIELEKLFLPKSSCQIPQPIKGKLPVGEYIMVGEVKVPYGFRMGVEQELIKKGYKIYK